RLDEGAPGAGVANGAALLCPSRLRRCPDRGDPGEPGQTRLATGSFPPELPRHSVEIRGARRSLSQTRAANDAVAAGAPAMAGGTLDAILSVAVWQRAVASAVYR